MDLTHRQLLRCGLLAASGALLPGTLAAGDGSSPVLPPGLVPRTDTFGASLFGLTLGIAAQARPELG